MATFIVDVFRLAEIVISLNEFRVCLAELKELQTAQIVARELVNPDKYTIYVLKRKGNKTKVLTGPDVVGHCQDMLRIITLGLFSNMPAGAESGMFDDGSP